MILGIPREVIPHESRVGIVPATVAALCKIPGAGVEVIFEKGAGEAAGFPDHEYEVKGAKHATSRDELFRNADVICQVWCACAKTQVWEVDQSRLRNGLTVIGHCDPLAPEKRDAIERMASTGVTTLAMELMPRITRAQSMDALSSQATLAGYKAVIIAADHLPKMFPMMMTAAGTLTAARVLVIGAGVAGLQAIATAKRLGAVVWAYDVRPAVKEQVESLGGRFLELGLESESAEGKGGYAKAMDEEFYAKQREMLGKAVADSDVVITTAAVPGRKSPVLVTVEMVEQMHPGAVIVDLAAERGGNCELTKADETVIEHGITILGPTNLPATVPFHASQMYSRNVEAFLKHLIKDGRLDLERGPDGDEIIRETLLTQGGEMVHSRLLQPAAASA